MAISHIIKGALPILLLATHAFAKCSQSNPVNDIFTRPDDSQTQPMSAGFTCTQEKVAQGRDCCILPAIGSFVVHGTQNLTTGQGPDWVYAKAQDNFPNLDDFHSNTQLIISNTTGCSISSEPTWTTCVPVGQSGHLAITPILQCRVGRVEGCDGSDVQYEKTPVEVCGAAYNRTDDAGNFVPNVHVSFVQQSQQDANAMTTNLASNPACNARTPNWNTNTAAGKTSASVGLSLIVALAFAVFL